MKKNKGGLKEIFAKFWDSKSVTRANRAEVDKINEILLDFFKEFES